MGARYNQVLAALSIAMIAQAASANVAASLDTGFGFSAGNLTSAFGPGQMRFLDDPAFGPPLGGGAAGLTASASMFNTGFFPPIDPLEFDIVLSVPKPVNPVTGNPERGMGLLVWPGTNTATLDQWVLVYDILIPAASWTQPFPAALANFDDNNGDDADIFILGQLTRTDPLRIGTKTNNVEATRLLPDRWSRITLRCDNRTNFETDIFLDGDFLGTIPESWPIFDNVDAANPTFVNGAPIPAADWLSWGMFPSPWEEIPSPINSTFTIFSDDNGESEAVEISSFAIYPQYPTDDPLPGCSDEPDPDEIVLNLCPADENVDCTVDVLDLLEFLEDWFLGFKDFNCDGGTDVLDLLEFLSHWFAGC